jgi:hypothetical protein
MTAHAVHLLDHMFAVRVQQARQSSMETAVGVQKWSASGSHSCDTPTTVRADRPVIVLHATCHSWQTFNFSVRARAQRRWQCLKTCPGDASLNHCSGLIRYHFPCHILDPRYKHRRAGHCEHIALTQQRSAPRCHFCASPTGHSAPPQLTAALHAHPAAACGHPGG